MHVSIDPHSMAANARSCREISAAVEQTGRILAPPGRPKDSTALAGVGVSSSANSASVAISSSSVAGAIALQLRGGKVSRKNAVPSGRVLRLPTTFSRWARGLRTPHSEWQCCGFDCEFAAAHRRVQLGPETAMEDQCFSQQIGYCISNYSRAHTPADICRSVSIFICVISWFDPDNNVGSQTLLLSGSNQHVGMHGEGHAR